MLIGTLSLLLIKDKSAPALARGGRDGNLKDTRGKAVSTRSITSYPQQTRQR